MVFRIINSFPWIFDTVSSEKISPASILFLLTYIIIHQTHYEKSNWSRAFNQFTIACELDMINAISAISVKFNVCLVTKPLGMFSSETKWLTLRFCFWGWIMWKMHNKAIIEFSFRMILWIIKTSCLSYLPQPLASADNTDLGFDKSWYHAQPHPIIVYWIQDSKVFPPAESWLVSSSFGCCSRMQNFLCL